VARKSSGLGDFSILQDGGRRHLGFSKFQIFNGGDGQEGPITSPCQISLKSAQTRPRYRDLFRCFKMAAAAILDFKKFKLFNGRNGQERQTASLCQTSSKSLETRPRYVSFNIMLVWLENAYSRPFLGVFEAHFPHMMSLIVVTRCI